jgi:lipid-A-disaccharide synthase-like uncharacterized protein
VILAGVRDKAETPVLFLFLLLLTKKTTYLYQLLLEDSVVSVGCQCGMITYFYHVLYMISRFNYFLNGGLSGEVSDL